MLRQENFHEEVPGVPKYAIAPIPAPWVYGKNNSCLDFCKAVSLRKMRRPFLPPDGLHRSSCIAARGTGFLGRVFIHPPVIYFRVPE